MFMVSVVVVFYVIVMMMMVIVILVSVSMMNVLVRLSRVLERRRLIVRVSMMSSVSMSVSTMSVSMSITSCRWCRKTEEQDEQEQAQGDRPLVGLLFRTLSAFVFHHLLLYRNGVGNRHVVRN